jgi:hypothetical protein
MRLAAVVLLTFALAAPVGGQVENADTQTRFDREWRTVLAEFPTVAGHLLALEYALRETGGKPSIYAPQFFTAPYPTGEFYQFGTKSYEWVGDECGSSSRCAMDGAWCCEVPWARSTRACAWTSIGPMYSPPASGTSTNGSTTQGTTSAQQRERLQGSSSARAPRGDGRPGEIERRPPRTDH